MIFFSNELACKGLWKQFMSLDNNYFEHTIVKIQWNTKTTSSMDHIKLELPKARKLWEKKLKEQKKFGIY